MKIIYFTVFILIGCHSSKSITKGTKNPKSIPIDIKFVLDKSNYSYQFRFLNKSTDSIEILRPMVYGHYCYFRKIGNGDTISNLRCGSFSQNQIDWILLPPREGNFNIWRA